MALLFKITSGWTGRLGPFTLRIDNNPVDLTGMTVEIKLRRWSENEVFTPGGSVYVDPDQVNNRGQVYYDPIDTDFVWASNIIPQQNYSIHWKVTDSGGKIVYFPNGEADQIGVFQE